jgi:hypothetical protein
MMKANCTVALLLIFCFLSCKKSSTSLKEDRLISFSDSSYHYQVIYSGNTISEIYADSLNGLALPNATHRALFSYSTNYIKADLYNSSASTEYFFNDAKRPTQIISSSINNGISTVTRSIKFFYNANSQLDSMTSNSPYFSFKTIPVYSNGNIIKYSRIAKSRSTSDTAVLSFTYSATPNVFLATNPYLFVYNDPEVSDQSFLLPTIFSTGTLQSFTLILNRGIPETKNFTYKTNAVGKLLIQDYGAGVYPYRREYKYQ